MQKIHHTSSYSSLRQAFDAALPKLRKDPILHNVLDTLGDNLPDFPIQRSLYSYLLKTIISQQLSTQSAASIYRRFIDTYGAEPAEETLIDTPLEKLSAIGLSRPKAKYIKAIAQYFKEQQRERWLTLDNKEIRESLLTIYGVGPWTVDMCCMFALGDLDVFPIGDLVIRKQISRLYSLPLEEDDFQAQAKKVAKEWKPYRSLVSFILWHWNSYEKKSK